MKDNNALAFAVILTVLPVFFLANWYMKTAGLDFWFMLGSISFLAGSLYLYDSAYDITERNKK